MVALRRLCIRPACKLQGCGAVEGLRKTEWLRACRSRFSAGWFAVAAVGYAGRARQSRAAAKGPCPCPFGHTRGGFMARRSVAGEVTRHPSQLLLLGFEVHGLHPVSALAGLAIALRTTLGRFAGREA